MLTEKELREVDDKRNDGFSWRDIAKHFECSTNTVRKRYIEWKEGETEFDEYMKMGWWERLKYAFKEVL